MTEQLHAILDDAGNVLQVVVWDGVTPWAPAKKFNVYPCTADVSLGWKHDGKQFVAPKVEPLTKDQLAAQDTMLAALSADAAADKG